MKSKDFGSCCDCGVAITEAPQHEDYCNTCLLRDEVDRLKRDLSLSKEESEMWKGCYERLKTISDSQGKIIDKYAALMGGKS